MSRRICYWFITIILCVSTLTVAGCGLKSKTTTAAPSATPSTTSTATSNGSDNLTLVTSSATLISDGQAALNGKLSGISNNKPVKVYFVYGTKQDNLSEQTSYQSLSSPTIYSQTISGLAPNTTYYFQAVAAGSTVIKGAVVSFTTAFINADYYYGFINSNGSLKFSDKSNGNLIMDNAPLFYCNYGASSTVDKSPANSSFETAKDGIPDGWLADQPYGRQSADYASRGKYSLKFDINAKGKAKYIFSPSIPIVPEKKYRISIDSYYLSLTNGAGAKIKISYIDAHDTKQVTDVLYYIPPTIGVWKTNTFEWIPEFKAKSFQIDLVSYGDEIAVVYYDNLVVTEVTDDYQTNGREIISKVAVSGDEVTVTSRDSSNSDIEVVNEYNLNVHQPEITYKPTIQYKKDVAVNEERFTFTVPTLAATVMMRDLNLVTCDVAKAYYSDHYTPKVVKFDNGTAFLGSDNMQSMKLDNNGGQSRVGFYSDYKYNHPYFNDSGDISAQRRSAGESYTSLIKLYIEPGKTAKSLVKARQPDGYDATLIQTSHADDEAARRVNAVAYGTEDTASAIYGSQGIVGNGLGWTKSVFVAGVRPPSEDLSNTAYKNLTDKLYHDGVEIIGHTITTGNDNNDVVISGLKLLSQYGARNWIDHGTNFEDLAHKGSLAGDPYYIVGLLTNAGYQYVWTYLDYTYAINIINPSRSGFIDSYFYYNRNLDNDVTDNKRLYLWSSNEIQNQPDLWYAGANIDALIAQRGIHIGHAYYANPAEENHAWWVNPATGKIEIFPAFETALEYMAAKRTAGLLWTPTMSEAGDFWKLLPDVLVKRISDNEYMVTNNNSVPVNRLTLLAENDIKSAKVNGTVINTYAGAYGSREVVISSIAPGESIKVTIGY